MAIDRKKMMEQMMARHDAITNPSSTDGGLWEPYFKIPEGYTQFSFKPPATEDGLNFGFDIIPFVVGDKYPTNNKHGIKKGECTYVLEVHKHSGVGPTKKQVVCPLKNYGEPCPICEKRIELQEKMGFLPEEEYKEWKKEHSELIPVKRVIYNIIVKHDKAEEEKGIQVYESSYGYSQEKITDKARIIESRAGGKVFFASVDKGENLGQTIWINFKLVGDRKWKVGGADFVERKYEYPDSIIDEAVSLDEMLVIYSYEEIQLIMGTAKKPHVADSQPMGDDVPLVSRRSPKPPIVEDKGVNTATGEITCPIDAEFGDDYDQYEECDKCQVKMYCKDVAESANEPEPEPEPVAEPEPPKRVRRALKA